MGILLICEDDAVYHQTLRVLDGQANLIRKLSIPIKTSTFFGNSEHSFPEKQSIPFRNRVQFIF